MIKHAAGISFFVGSAMFLSTALQAQVTTTWEGGSSAAFETPGNWSDGVPSAADNARFVDAGAAEVTFSGNHDYNLGGGDIIGLTLIPEPSAGALWGGVAVVVWMLFRRRALSRRI